jgi:hypothetical protein
MGWRMMTHERGESVDGEPRRSDDEESNREGLEEQEARQEHHRGDQCGHERRQRQHGENDFQGGKACLSRQTYTRIHNLFSTHAHPHRQQHASLTFVFAFSSTVTFPDIGTLFASSSTVTFFGTFTIHHSHPHRQRHATWTFVCDTQRLYSHRDTRTLSSFLRHIDIDSGKPVMASKAAPSPSPSASASSASASGVVSASKGSGSAEDGGVWEDVEVRFDMPNKCALPKRMWMWMTRLSVRGR